MKRMGRLCGPFSFSEKEIEMRVWKRISKETHSRFLFGELVNTDK